MKGSAVKYSQGNNSGHHYYDNQLFIVSIYLWRNCFERCQWFGISGRPKSVQFYGIYFWLFSNRREVWIWINEQLPNYWIDITIRTIDIRGYICSHSVLSLSQFGERSPKYFKPSVKTNSFHTSSILGKGSERIMSREEDIFWPSL